MRMLLFVGVMIWHVASSAIVSRDVYRSAETAIPFSDRSFKAIAEDATGNFVYSPISLTGLLSMASWGAAGNTKSQLLSAIEHPYESAPSREPESSEESSEESQGVELSLSYKIFLAEGFTPNPEFTFTTSTWFHAEVQNVDFGKPAEATKAINEWGADRTSNRITNLVQSGDVSSTTALVLANVVYFKGDWLKKFNEKKTSMRPFFVNGGSSVKWLPTMHRVDNYRYGELPEVKAKFIELPYKTNAENDPVSMFIILPDEVNGLSELIRNFDKVTVQKLHEGEELNVELFLPKFKIESTIDLETPLGKLGLADIFGDSADFSGISNERPLKISKIVQKNFINVNEQGTEAAAISQSEIESRRLHDVAFLVDHPFISVIVTEFGIPVFTAVTVDPSSQS